MKKLTKAMTLLLALTLPLPAPSDPLALSIQMLDSPIPLEVK